MRLTDYRFTVTREPLVRPFSFKGGSFTEKWITVTSLAADNGTTATAIGGLAVLWSDARIFAEHSEAGGNILMSAIAEYAARSAVGLELGDGKTTPVELQDAVLEQTSEYAARVTGRADVRRTFVLNCLVSLDLALWKLYASATGAGGFEEMIPGRYRDALEARHEAVAHVPLVTYGIEADELAGMADRGTFLFKIKLGQKGSQREMLQKDMDRLSEIHRTIGSRDLPGSPSGKPLYYLDANGRYETRDALERMIDHLDAIGALDRVVVVEEPFPPEARVDVGDLPVRVAGDESVESEGDVKRLADQGFRAIAVKPAGKTLSASLRAVKTARSLGLDCFVADSACVPQLVDWNRNVAARLPAIPGVRHGMLESNGADHYRNWQRMLDEHPCRDAAWLVPQGGVYTLGADFYDNAGCIFKDGGRYEELLPEWA